MRKVALLAGLGVAALALTSCASGPGPESGGEEELKLVNSMPAASTQIDSFTWNIPDGEPNSLDPARAGTANQTVQSNLCENLLLITDDHSLASNLGTVEQEDDLTYSVTLRDDVAFWDGTPITADDAIWSMERYLAGDLGVVFETQARYVESLEKTGDLSYTIHMSQPDAAFYGLLSGPLGVVQQQAFSETAGENLGKPDTGVMCTGPFKLKEWAVGDSIVLEKNENYWDGERQPFSNEVKFTFNTDVASTTAAMKNGEINGTFNFPYSALGQLKASDGTVTFGPSVAFYAAHFINIDSSPLADVKLREALIRAIDYNGIRSGVLKGVAAESRSIVMTGQWGYEKEKFEQAWDELYAGQQDLEQAKALVEEVGAPTEPAVFAYRSTDDTHAQIAAAVQAAGKEIGIELELKALPPAQFSPLYYDPSAREGIDMMLFDGYQDLPPEPVVWLRNYQTDGSFDMAKVSNPEYDQIINTAFQTLDDAERAELVIQAQRILADEAIIAPIAEKPARVWTSKGITGVPTSSIHYWTPWAASVGGV